MRKGDIVLLLPHNPYVASHGVSYGSIISTTDEKVTVQLCHQQKTEILMDRKLVTVIDRDQCPKELLFYAPYEKMNDAELRERLDLIDRKLNAIGQKLGL